MYDIIIIGAGIIGSLLARELSRYQLKVLVLEKNNDVGNETSNANSAIVHSGYDPEPNSLKATLNVLGNAMYEKLCDELDVKFKRIGSITLAFNEEECKTLSMLHERAKNNHVETLILNKQEVLEKEPLVNDNVLMGLYAPSAGIVDPFNLTIKAMENALDNQVELILNHQVKEIIKQKDYFIIDKQYKSKIVINAAGLYSDEINNLICKEKYHLLPRKGEYYVLNHFTFPFVKHTLFLTPSINGKGVLISPTTSNNYLIGPSADLVEKEDKDTDKLTLNKIKIIAQKMLKNIPFDQTIRTFAGIRPTPTNHDFIIQESSIENFINLIGIESPGLASAPAIVKKVIQEIIAKKINLKEKENFNPRVRKHFILKELTIEEKNKLIQKDSSYGKIICRCEQVSAGEIFDVLNRNNPPRSIKALKKRIRVGFGKCQGGMCQAASLKILADFYHVDMQKIPYDNLPSYILDSKTKGGK